VGEAARRRECVTLHILYIHIFVYICIYIRYTLKQREMLAKLQGGASACH